MNSTDLENLPPATPPALPPVLPPALPNGPAPASHAKYRLPPLHPEGRSFVAISGGLALLFGVVLGLQPLGWLFAGLTLWVAAFFRDPERTTPAGDGLIISPADGMVCAIAEVPLPRQLAGDGGLPGESALRVSVFMNVFDVHINRSPVAGLIRRIVYVPGKFLNADLDKASDDNERQYFIVEDAAGARFGFTQIAGLIARRIVRFASEGDRVAAGERVGLIRFGSRVDVYLPAGYGCAVLAGQRTTAGETVLARLGEPHARAAGTQ